MKQDFENKIVLVIRKDLKPWVIANTIGHLSAYFGNQLKGEFGTGKDFVTKDGVLHPRNSQYAIIIKRAKSAEQLNNFMDKVRESEILYHGFVREMVDYTNDGDLQKALIEKEDKEVEYLGIGVFGKKEQTDKLTKKFGLWN